MRGGEGSGEAVEGGVVEVKDGERVSTVEVKDGERVSELGGVPVVVSWEDGGFGEPIDSNM